MWVLTIFTTRHINIHWHVLLLCDTQNVDIFLPLENPLSFFLTVPAIKVMLYDPQETPDISKMELHMHLNSETETDCQSVGIFMQIFMICYGHKVLPREPIHKWITRSHKNSRENPKKNQLDRIGIKSHVFQKKKKHLNCHGKFFRMEFPLQFSRLRHF